MSRRTRVIRSRGFRYGSGYSRTDPVYNRHLVYPCTRHVKRVKQRNKLPSVAARYVKYSTPVLMGRRYSKQVLFRK